MAAPTARLDSVEVQWETVLDRAAYPFSIPAICSLHELDLSSPVTFFIGDNGTGKSTLLEALAVAAELNPEGGSRNLRFADRPTESVLHEHLRLVWQARHRWAFFLRAETFFATASAYERVDVGSFHQRSHGEQFIDAALSMFKAGGLHLLDEPEAALSLSGQLKLLRRIHDVASADGQFIVATHSPILLAYPGACIYSFDDDIQRVEYRDTDPYLLTKSFLDAPERFLHHLFADDDT